MWCRMRNWSNVEPKCGTVWHLRDLRSRMSSHTRLTMEPFPEKPIDNVSGGASHKFNAIHHGRETAEITGTLIGMKTELLSV